MYTTGYYYEIDTHENKIQLGETEDIDKVAYWLAKDWADDYAMNEETDHYVELDGKIIFEFNTQNHIIDILKEWEEYRNANDI